MGSGVFGKANDVMGVEGSAEAREAANAVRVREERDRLISKSVSFAEFAQRRGGSVEAARRYVSGNRQSLLVVEVDGESVFPLVGLTSSCDFEPALVAVLVCFREAGWSDWAIWMWLESSSGWLNGEVPSGVLRDEPGRVLEAAQRRVRNTG